MQGLLSKLAGLDSSIERALRIVEFFDQLVLHQGDVDAIVRASAILAECTVGASFDKSGETVVMGADGEQLAARRDSNALTRPIVIDEVAVGQVWISRGAEPPREWDELVAERMSLALASLVTRPSEAADVSGLADPAIAHVLLRGSSAETDAARAARLLGFPVGQRVRLVALGTGDAREVARARQLLERAAGALAVAAPIDEQLAVIFVATDNELHVELPGLAAAIGSVTAIERCAVSWTSARAALRLAALGGSWPNVLNAHEAGGFLALVDLDPASVAKIPDVQRIAAIVAEGGREDMLLVDCVTTTASLRRAAEMLHMHHSSATYRVERLSKRLGFDLKEPENKLRARLALTLWQLHVAP